MSKNIILSKDDISNKLRRIAFQIYESNADESTIVLAGIAKNGYTLAEKLAEILTSISDLNIKLCEVIVDKKNVFNPVKTSLDPDEYKDLSIVLIDDVLHTGATLMYGVKHFLDVPLKQFKTVVLIDRNHKKFPIKADFKGVSLSTSYQNNVEVVLENDDYKAYLE